MTLVFTLSCDACTTPVGFGGVPIRITNIRTTSSTDDYLSTVFTISSSGKGHFRDPNNSTLASGVSVRWAWKFHLSGASGMNGSYNTLEVVYYPEETGTHQITVMAAPCAIANVPNLTLGSTATKSLTASAMYCDNAKAMFTKNVTDGYAPLTVQFTCVTPDQNIQTVWDFSDGATSTQRNPSHTYQTAGTFRPKLTVIGWKNSACTGTAPSNSVSDLINVLMASAPQCVTGYRCAPSGWYEECIGGKYQLTSVSCAKPTDTGTAATTGAAAAAAAAGTPVATPPSSILAPSTETTGSSTGGIVGGTGGGTGGGSGIGLPDWLLNPLTLAAVGLGIAGAVVYFVKFRRAD